MIFNAATQATLTLISDKEKPAIVLGLSGGPDSVFLFYVLLELHKEGKLTLIATHLDHEWRAESAHDLAFCKALCANHDVTFIGARAGELELSRKASGSKEDLGRTLRRTLFEKVLKENNAHFIALAHHLDDQEETFFIRLIRGASLDGLTSMKDIHGPYIRPLLNFKKEDILAWLNNNNYAYLHDPTNTSDDFLRNRIRKTVIPALRGCDERFDIKFASTLRHLHSENELLELLTKKYYDEVFKNGKGSRTAFLNLESALQRRVIMLWLTHSGAHFSPSEGHIEEVIRFIASPRGGAHTIGQSTVVHKKSDEFWVVAA